MKKPGLCCLLLLLASTVSLAQHGTSVFYMQESPYKEGSLPVEMILTLVLGRKAYSDIENEMRNLEVVSIARAVVPLKAFEESSVETIYLGKRQPVIITLKCSK